MFIRSFLCLLLMCTFLGNGQIVIDNTWEEELDITFIKESKSCDCLGFMQRIHEGDFDAVQQCVDQGLDPNCEVKVEIKDRRRALFGHKYYSKYFYLTPIQFTGLKGDYRMLEIVYPENQFAKENIETFIDSNYTEKESYKLGMINFLEWYLPERADSNRNDSIIDYFQSRGVMENEELIEIDKKLIRYVWDVREDKTMSDSFRIQTQKIGNVAISDNRKLLYYAFIRNYTDAYTYLVEQQHYNVQEPYVYSYSYRRRTRSFFDIFAPRGKKYEHENSMQKAIIFSTYPTAELLDFGLKHGAISGEDISMAADADKWVFKRKFMSKGKLYRKYLLLYKQLWTGENTDQEIKKVEKKMDKIRQRLFRANHLSVV